jgi:hypothetical protein
MRIQLFKNKKGLISGSDSKRIECDKGGVLKIGASEISISPGKESVMPILLNGCNGIYNATFTDEMGQAYELERVTIKGGRITPPPQTSVELMELRHRLDVLETENEVLWEKIHELSNIFDTNSLNFLIK